MHIHFLSMMMLFQTIMEIVHGTPVTNSANMTNVSHVMNGINTKLVGPLVIAAVITSLLMVLIGKFIKEHHGDIIKWLLSMKRRLALAVAFPWTTATGRRQGRAGSGPDDDADGDMDVGDVTELIDMPAAAATPDSIEADLVSLRAFLAATDPKTAAADTKGKAKATTASASAGATTPATGPRRVTWGLGTDLPRPESPVLRGSRAPRREAPRPGESEAGPSGTNARARKDEGPNSVFW